MDFVFTNGRFDILHPGHIKLFQHCATKGLPVIVGINSDESCKKLGKPTVMDENSRFLLVSSCKFISIAFVFDYVDARELIASMPVKPFIWIIGDDHKDEDFSKVQCQVEFIHRSEYSSSKIKESIRVRENKEVRK